MQRVYGSIGRASGNLGEERERELRAPTALISHAGRREIKSDKSFAWNKKHSSTFHALRSGKIKFHFRSIFISAAACCWLRAVIYAFLIEYDFSPVLGDWTYLFEIVK